MQVQDRVFLVSGGSSGLGAACARMIVRAGGKVVIADLNRVSGEGLAKELGPRARFIVCDVTDETNVQAAVDTAIQTHGGLHGAIACAGIGLAEKLISKSGSHSQAAFTHILHVNLIGTFNVLRLAAATVAHEQPLSSGERGVIIMTASIAAFEGQIGQIAYAASKGGVAAMTLPAARELARNGIRVVTIAPGIFDTPLLAGLPEAARESLGEQVPFPARLGRPEEFAALARHIIENEMLNGTVLRVDGALRMAPR